MDVDGILYAKKKAPIQAFVPASPPSSQLLSFLDNCISEKSFLSMTSRLFGHAICTMHRLSKSFLCTLNVPLHCTQELFGPGRQTSELISLDLVNTSQLIKPSKQANKVFVLLRKHLAFSSVPPPFLPLLACNFKPHVKQRNMRWFTRKQIFLFLSNFPSSFFYTVFAGNKHQYIRPRVCKTPNTL